MIVLRFMTNLCYLNLIATWTLTGTESVLSDTEVSNSSFMLLAQICACGIVCTSTMIIKLQPKTHNWYRLTTAMLEEMYRVTIHVVPILLLTPQQRFHFSTCTSHSNTILFWGNREALKQCSVNGVPVHYWDGQACQSLGCVNSWAPRRTCRHGFTQLHINCLSLLWTRYFLCLSLQDHHKLPSFHALPAAPLRRDAFHMIWGEPRYLYIILYQDQSL